MSLDNGLVQVKTDNDVLNMVDCHKKKKVVVLYTVSAVDDYIPLNSTLPEVLVADKSKGKGKETETSNKRSKLPIIGGENKNRCIKITDRQPSVKGKEKEVANRSKGKRKEKMFEVSFEKEYDADDDVDCGDFDNDNEVGLEVEDEDEDFELDLGMAYLVVKRTYLIQLLLPIAKEWQVNQQVSQLVKQQVNQPAKQLQNQLLKLLQNKLKSQNLKRIGILKWLTVMS